MSETLPSSDPNIDPSKLSVTERSHRGMAVSLDELKPYIDKAKQQIDVETAHEKAMDSGTPDGQVFKPNGIMEATGRTRDGAKVTRIIGNPSTLSVLKHRQGMFELTGSKLDEPSQRKLDALKAEQKTDKKTLWHRIRRRIGNFATSSSTREIQ